MRALLVYLVLSAGCLVAPSSPRPADSACDRAVEHVSACVGAQVVAPEGGCEPALAEHLLSRSCEALVAEAALGKADGPFGLLGALACAGGFVRYCPPASCGAARAPGPTDRCADYLETAGCGGCQYYACREAAAPCGADGYYLGFAQKYCERLLVSLRPRLSAAGQRFLDRGRDCLMRFAEAELPSSLACDELERRGLDSHVVCYRESGFCALPLGDRVRLFAAVDPDDLDLRSALATGLSCLGDRP